MKIVEFKYEKLKKVILISYLFLLIQFKVQKRLLLILQLYWLVKLFEVLYLLASLPNIFNFVSTFFFCFLS